jgi:hypothetical protein
VLCVTGTPPDRACRRADEVERWLASPDLEILGAAATPRGIQGAVVLTLRYPGPPEVVFRAKWRAQSTLTRRNDPRRELVAYEVQKLFLEPDEYVVPPAAAHCFPVAMIQARISPRVTQSFRDVPCVLGYLSYWLEDVTSLKDAERQGWFDADGNLLDRDLFDENPFYRDSLANTNLLTYLIEHDDSHSGQFLLRRDPAVPHVFSVDNSMSFGVKKNSRLRVDWSRIQVPALSRRALERLRAANIDRLASISELQLAGRGRLVPVAPRRRGTEPAAIRWIEGRLVVGVTVDELDSLRERVNALFLAIDRGEVKVY